MPRKLQRSVGVGAVNAAADVAVVQDLLNLVPVASGGPSPLLKVDGLCFGKTQDAIKAFQKRGAGFVTADGRVDPGGRTLLKLNEFEKNGSKQFQVLRMELGTLSTPRTGATSDRFYLIRDQKTGQQAIYFFSAAGTKLADVPATLAKLKRRPEELTAFQTKEFHSIAGFQCPDALHSEISSSATSARIALSFVLPDETVIVQLNHKWLTPTTTVGQTTSMRGIATFQGATIGVS